MRIRKILALVLAFAMLAVTAAAGAEWSESDFEQAAKIVTALKADYTGKTVILHTNDVHGVLEGYAYVAALRNVFVERGADVILADAGDFSQGTTYVSASKGATAIQMMNAAQYDVVTLGNHEFDFGYESLMNNLSRAEFKPICANVLYDETNEPILDPSTIITTRSGLKVGFFGLETPETATKVNPGLIKNIHFTMFEDLYTCAQSAIDGLAEADLVFGLVHLGVDAESAGNGYRSIDLYSKVTGVDMLIDGHSHTAMTVGENGEPIQSTGTGFAYIGAVVIDNESKKIEDNFLIPTSVSGVYEMETEPIILMLAKGLEGVVDIKYNAVFASTDVLLNGERNPGNRTEETNLGDLITDAMVWSVVKEGGIEQVEPNAVVGVTNGGGIRATIQAGSVTMKDINTVLPFGNTVAVIYVTGEELLEVLEASTFCTPDAIGGYPQTSGIEWTLDTTKPYDQGDIYVLNGKETTYYAPKSIQRVTITAINGEPFDPAATYAVVTNNFCAAGGDTYNVFANSQSSFDTGIPMDEAVIAYITEVLGGKITEAAYGAPRGTETQIR